jgi:hypothetical protein
MGIRLTGSKVKITPPMDRVFVKQVNITQDRFTDNARLPLYRVRCDYQLYGVDDDNVRHYDGVMRTITIEDFVRESQGNAVRLGALQALEHAIADILTEDPSVESAAAQ